MPPYFLDLWSLGHLALWAVFGFWSAKRLGDLSRRERLVFCAAIGLYLGGLWEAFEWLAVEPLLGFAEPWHNRLVSDMFMDLIGTLFGATAALASSRER